MDSLSSAPGLPCIGSRYASPRPKVKEAAAAVYEAVVAGFTPYKERVHTLTYDNDREFLDHHQMASDLEARVYFALPIRLGNVG